MDNEVIVGVPIPGSIFGDPGTDFSLVKSDWLIGDWLRVIGW